MDISVANVSVKIAPDQRLLFKIPNFKVKAGEKVLIQGASGTGKTTFIHLLAGLFTPDEGYINIGETDITRLDEEARDLFRRNNIGLVFQKLNLIDHLTALENIELTLRNRDKMDRAVTSLKLVGLEGREHDKTAVLSLGEQQRVAIARVLAGDPRLVFADEPTSSLDEKNANEVTELLINSSKNKTLLVVSHDHRIERYFSSKVDFEELIS